MAFKFPNVYDALYAKSVAEKKNKHLTKKVEEWRRVAGKTRKEAKETKEQLENEINSVYGELNKYIRHREESLAEAGLTGYMEGLTSQYSYFVETRPKGLYQSGNVLPTGNTNVEITKSFEKLGLKEYPPGFVNKTTSTPLWTGQQNDTPRLKSKNISWNTPTQKLFTSEDVDYHLWYRPKKELQPIAKSQFFKDVKIHSGYLN